MALRLWVVDMLPGASETSTVEASDWLLRPLRLHLAGTIVGSDHRIRVGPPKTHDVVVVTASLMNS